MCAQGHLGRQVKLVRQVLPVEASKGKTNRQPLFSSVSKPIKAIQIADDIT
jgi:hypothetical protein